MENRSDDAPKPPRKGGSVLPPFVGPRTGESSPPRTALPATPRRGAQLFTPRPTPPAAAVPMPADPAKPGNPSTPPQAAAASPPASAASPQSAPTRHTGGSPGEDHLVVENEEPKQIELTITAEQLAVNTAEYQVIAYDEANSLLQSQAPEGGRPRVDDMELEETELELQPPPSARQLEVESFWAAEPLAPREGVKSDLPAAEPSPPLWSAPKEGDEPSTWQTLNPPPRRESAPRSAAGAAARAEPPERATRPEDAERELRAALESFARETPLRAPASPLVERVDPIVVARTTPAASTPVADGPKAGPAGPKALEHLKELEPWSAPVAEPTNSAEAIAAMLEHLARRLRDGQLVPQAGAAANTEEAALAAVLAALRHAGS